MRFVFLFIALAGFVFAFFAKTPGMLGLGLALGLICLFASVFGFAAERVASAARPDAALLTDQDINALRASIRKPGTTTQTAPPTQSA